MTNNEPDELDKLIETRSRLVIEQLKICGTKDFDFPTLEAAWEHFYSKFPVKLKHGGPAYMAMQFAFFSAIQLFYIDIQIAESDAFTSDQTDAFYAGIKEQLRKWRRNLPNESKGQ